MSKKNNLKDLSESELKEILDKVEPITYLNAICKYLEKIGIDDCSLLQAAHLNFELKKAILKAKEYQDEIVEKFKS